MTKIERLRRFYNQFVGKDHTLIVINADPDSIASALAVKRLLWRRVAEVAIMSVNQVDRPENRAMADILKVGLNQPNEIDHDKFNKTVLVDSQPSHHPKFDRFSFDVIIDHHPLDSDIEASFKDIRPHYGATASIMTEYLKAAGIRPNKNLAAALFYAIKTDTGNFARRAVSEDVKAFQFLHKLINVNMIKKIEKTGVRGKYLKYFEKALINRRRVKGDLITHLHTVASPDICVIIADFFMNVDFVTWCFVAGIHQKTLIIIIRNDGIRKNAGEFAKKKFGKLGTAGGHKTMARAEILVDQLKRYCDPKKEDEVLKWLVKKIKRP